jgi:MATE family multidrug resistance protein
MTQDTLQTTPGEAAGDDAIATAGTAAAGAPTHMTPDPHPLRETARIAVPTIATMASYTVMTFADKWLVSRLGPEYVGAQGNGGLASWVPISLAMGTVQIINSYVSQNMGAGKPERGAAYAWNGMWIALLWSIILIPYGFLLPWIFRQTHMDPQQTIWAGQYGQILVFGAFLTMATRSLSQFFYGLHRAGIITVAGVVANIVNLILSAVLIFGNGPIPAGLGAFGRLAGWIGRGLDIEPMGITGSAYGTVIATGVELAIPLAVFLSPKFNFRYHTRRAWRWSGEHMKDILRLGWPGGAMFGNEMICWGFFMVYLVSHFGPQHASAGWIAHQYMSLSFMPAVGISVAVSALVGKYMGMKRPDLAASRAWLGLRLALVYMGTCGVLFVVFRHALIDLFIEADTPPELRAEIVRLGAGFLIAAAAFQLFDAIAMTMSGALRGAGDTVWVGVVTVTLAWVIIVGGGLAMITYLPRLESLGPWIAAAAYIMALSVVSLGRFLSGHWRTRTLVKDAPIAAH